VFIAFDSAYNFAVDNFVLAHFVFCILTLCLTHHVDGAFLLPILFWQFYE